MAARGLTRKEMKQDEFIEKAADFGGWLEDNWRKVATWAGALLLIFILVLVFVYVAQSRREKAQVLLGQGYQLFIEAENSGDYSTAIETLQEASAKAGGHATGQLADYYIGMAYLRTGETEKGIELLEAVKSAGEIDTLLREQATVTLANTYAETGESAKAVEMLREMAGNQEAVYPPEMALVMAGKILRDSGDDAGARQIWQEVVNEHPRTAGAMEAEALLD